MHRQRWIRSTSTSTVRPPYAVIGAAAFQVDDIHVTVEAIEA